MVARPRTALWAWVFFRPLIPIFDLSKMEDYCRKQVLTIVNNRRSGPYMHVAV